MTEKRLGPEGARFKKGSWAPTNEGSGATKRTYLDEREALEARIVELEAKNSELEASLTDPSLGVVYREVALPSWVTSEFKGPYIFEQFDNEKHGPLDSKTDIILEEPSLLFNLKEQVYQAFERTRGKSQKVAPAIARSIINDISVIAKQATYIKQPPCVTPDDKRRIAFCVHHANGTLILCTEVLSVEFLIQSGTQIDVDTKVYRYPMTAEQYANLRAAYDEQEDLSHTLFDCFIERSEMVARKWGDRNELARDRRYMTYAAIAGWLAAALIWYF